MQRGQLKGHPSHHLSSLLSVYHGLLPALLIILLPLGCGCSGITLAGDAGQDREQIEDMHPDSLPETRCPGGMVLISAGPFVMGADPGEEYNDDTMPEHIVTLSAYCMDVLEVTNAGWKECVAAGECTEPYGIWSITRPDYYTNPSYDNYPVIAINWDQAGEYCKWLGKRLPTEAQWEKAARGGCELGGRPETCDDPEDERMYPWGNDQATCDSENICFPDTEEVGQYPSSESPYGVLDLMGNVNEMVSDWYAEDYYATGGPSWIDPHGPEQGIFRVFRGGCFDCAHVKLMHRGISGPGATSGTGFRCSSEPL